MADTQGLRMIGLVYGAVTGLVMLIACVVVSSHALGHLSLESTRTVIQQASFGR